jgi:hypothetical protein
MRQAIQTSHSVNAQRNTKCANAVLQTRLSAVKNKAGHEAAHQFCFNFACTTHFYSLQTFAAVPPDSYCLQLRVVLTFNRERWRAREN